MLAVIPVAGVGSRLRPHTYSLPKVLLTVAGKPIIGHILDKVIADGFDRATIIVGYMGDKIREYVLANYSIQVDFIDQEERKGLAHAMYLAHETLTDEPFLIILGDTIFDVDLKSVVAGEYSSVGVKYVEDPRRFGVTEQRDGFVSKFIEKPQEPTSNLALVGLYWIKQPRLLKECINDILSRNIRTQGEYQLTDALQLMLERGEKITAFPVDGWYDCGKPETLLATNSHLLSLQKNRYTLDGVVIVPPVFIAETAKITHSVIGPFATVSAGTVVENSVIRNSIVSDDAQVYCSVLENSIIGNNASVKGAFKRINVGDSSEIDFY